LPGPSRNWEFAVRCATQAPRDATQRGEGRANPGRCRRKDPTARDVEVGTTSPVGSVQLADGLGARRAGRANGTEDMGGKAAGCRDGASDAGRDQVVGVGQSSRPEQPLSIGPSQVTAVQLRLRVEYPGGGTRCRLQCRYARSQVGLPPTP